MRCCICTDAEGEWHKAEGGCEGAWGAPEAIGRFVVILLATPMALVMRICEAA